MAYLCDHFPVGYELNLKRSTSGSNASGKMHFKCARWRWDKTDLGMYYCRTLELAAGISVPTDLLHCDCDVMKCTHWHRVNDYYNDIVHALHQSMYECIPMCQGSFFQVFLD